MNHDPPRLRDDPQLPDDLRELLSERVGPPKLDTKTKAAALAGVLAGGTAAASATTATGIKLWLIAGGVSVVGIVAGVVITDQAAPETQAPVVRAAEPVETETPEARAQPELEAVEPEPEPEPEPDEPELAAQPLRRATPPAPPSTPETLRAEASLLETARARLEADPRSALRVTRRHEREYPDGQLRAERELLAIQALQRLGRASDARRRARAFLRAHPTGIYADRARVVLE